MVPSSDGWAIPSYPHGRNGRSVVIAWGLARWGDESERANLIRTIERRPLEYIKQKEVWYGGTGTGTALFLLDPSYLGRQKLNCVSALHCTLHAHHTLRTLWLHARVPQWVSSPLKMFYFTLPPTPDAKLHFISKTLYIFSELLEIKILVKKLPSNSLVN